MRKILILLCTLFTILSINGASYAVSVDTPKSFKAYQSNYSQKTITSWNKVKADGYEIKRKCGNGSWKHIAYTTKTKYTSKALTANKTYYYKVRAYKIVKNKKVYGSYTTIKKVKVLGTKTYTLPANGELYMESMWIGDRIKTDGRLNLPKDSYSNVVIYLHDEMGGVITSFVIDMGDAFYISKSKGFTKNGCHLYWKGYEVGYIRLYTDVDVDSTVAVRRE